MSEQMMLADKKAERPGCATAYAVGVWFVTGLGLILVLCSLSGVAGVFEGGFGGLELICGLVVLGVAAIFVVAGVGVWQMKKWGWALVIALHGIHLALQLMGMAVTLLGLVGSGGEYIGAEPSVLCGSLLGALISAFVIYWFVTNRALFNGGRGTESVVGPDGGLRPEPVKKTSDATILLAVGGGLVLVFILVCVVLLVLLAVMGPQIGNVFSQITFELENPPVGVVPWLW